MRLLIDTQVLLWFLQNSNDLSEQARDLIIDPDNDVCVSIASYWEIGIKQKKSPTDMPWTASVPALEHLALSQDIVTLPITPDAIEHTKQLSLDHKDPFDRIIAASAVVTGLRLISSDAAMDVFVDDRIWE